MSSAVRRWPASHWASTSGSSHDSAHGGTGVASLWQVAGRGPAGLGTSNSAQRYLKTEIIVVPSRGGKPTVGVYSHTNLGTHPTSPSVVVLSDTGAASTQEPARSGFQKRPCVGYGIPAGLLCSGVTCCPRIEPASPDSVFGVGDSGVKTIILCPRRRAQTANQALMTDC